MRTNWTRSVADLTRRERVSVDGQQRYGMEVELEYVDPHTYDGVRDGWNVTGDGSLRHNGVEFLTPPSTMAELDRLVHALYKRKEKYGWQGGPRCGIHLHMDMGERNIKQLHAFLVAYACVEPLIFQHCGTSREENIYCVPWYRAPNDLDSIRQMLYHPIRGALREVRQRTNKYTSLYVEPLARFNTVEFRGAPVYASPDATMELVHMFERLLDNTLMSSGEDVIDIFVDNPAQGLEQFFPVEDVEGSVALIEETDSIGTAFNLVRTKLEEDDWQFGTSKFHPQRERPRREAEAGIRLERDLGRGRAYRLDR